MYSLLCLFPLFTSDSLYTFVNDVQNVTALILFHSVE